MSDVFIPRGEGRAFTVDAGQVFRLVQPDGGGQVADLMAFNRADTSERIWGSRTAWRFGMHLTTGAQLISTAPAERALLTVVDDSLTREPTERGSYFHDVLMGCCSSLLRVQLFGPQWQGVPGCFEALAGAIAEYGMPPHYVQDTFNIFMRTGMEGNRPFLEVCDAPEGAYMTLRAEVDLVVAISACQGRSSQPDSNGLLVEIQNSPLVGD